MLPWCIQVTDAEIDFQPGDLLTLPPQLNPPLRSQEFAVRGRALFGIGCPSRELVMDMLSREVPAFTHGLFFPRYRVPVIPVTSLRCFALECFAVGNLQLQTVGSPPVETVGVNIRNLEVVDLQPNDLESAVECYITTLAQVVVMPRLALALHKAVTKTLGLLEKSQIKPRFAAGLPHNPAIEGHELRVWVDVDIQ